MPADPPAALWITPDSRRRLSQRYEEATRLAACEPTDFRGIHDLLAECLRSDPGNILYLDALLANLRRWNPQPKRSWLSAWLTGTSPHRAATNTMPNTQYLALSNSADEALKLLQDAPNRLLANPADMILLRDLALACETCDLPEAELRYLQAAFDRDPKNADTLRHLATTLLRQGRFEDALPVWHKIAEATPGDTFAAQALADLRSDLPFDDAATVALHEKIRSAPTAVEPYLHLSEILIAAGELDEAEALLLAAQSACGGDLRLCEERERLQLARSDQRLAIARRRAASDSHPRARQLLARLEQEHNRLAIDILNLRSERLPADMNLRLELARRLKQAGNYSGAIQRLEEAQRDSALTGAALLELGECWQHLRQFAKALEFYRQATEACEQSGGPIWRSALYRRGVLAAAMNDPVQARSAFEQLVADEPDYKDARQRLDKLP